MIKSFKDSEICKKFSHKDKGKILIYIELLYSIKGELAKEADIQKRIQAACESSGLDPEEHSDIITLVNPDVRNIVYYYLSYYQNSNRFHLLQSRQKLFWDIQQELMNPDSKLDHIQKLALSEKCNKLLTDINSLISELYEEPHGKPVADLAEESMREEKIRILRPEDRIQRKSV